ncbi:zinc-dependent metalloprotease [Corynebacterium lizhenjunii]|uniref:zinc-dependent metalloprotease n=1 Tax=Corynebacterium lizhenjunii TaxID=2709394 RepID=UPI0013EB7E76|nr:zinc-dependent metalloprotease [Corynebacterium lizhenjunii]
MSNGFGFNFPNNDDDGEDRRNNNPFGAFGFGPFGAFNIGGPAGGSGASGSGSGQGGPGGLGDILNQFGQMLSGMGSSMNSPENAGPVNFDLAKRIAIQQLGNAGAVSPADRNAVQEATRLAELWLDDATSLPAASTEVQAWNAADWLEATLPQWQRLVTPVAQHLNEAQLDSLPEEAREMMGPMSSMMQQFSGMNTGMQVGGALARLAQQALTGADFGLPVSPAGTTALLPHNITAIAKDLDVPAQEVLVYVAAREAARQRLFSQVPWLVERIVSSVEEYALGVSIDTSHIEEAARELDLQSGDPAAIQEALNKLQGMDLTPRISSNNAAATARLETLLALVEGWVDVVVYNALSQRLPSTTAMAAAWARRTASGGSAEHALAQVVSVEISAPQVGQAAELWRRSTNAVGATRRDSVWEHPDFLPTAEHLDNPAAFIDSLLDDAPTDDFEEEFAKLEQMLLQQDGTSEEQDQAQTADDSRDEDDDPDTNDKQD